MRRKAFLGLPLAALTGLGLLLAGSATQAAPQQTVTLTPLGTYATGQYDQSAAEIVKYDPGTKRLFVVNAQASRVDVLNAANPGNPVKIGELDATLLGGGANSVDVRDGIVAVAIEANVKTDNGLVAFYFADTLKLIGTVPAGALPDMLTFTPDGKRVLVANEGEPSDDYSVDPVGSITVIDLPPTFEPLKVRDRNCERFGGGHPLCSANIPNLFRTTTVGFEAFIGKEDSLRAQGVRIFGPGANAAQDFEPEYIAVSKDSRTAYVALQENNAFAIIDLRKLKVEKIVPLGFKDHSLADNGLDASDRDNAINIKTWPVFGIYMPDAIASYEYRGKTYIVSANEGDAREWGTFAEEARIGSLSLDPVAFPNAAELKQNTNLGRLNATTTLGKNSNGDFEKPYVFGGRSFSIWDENGKQVFDSGDQFEKIIADLIPDYFNFDNAENDTFDNRSDNKGPEPEGIAIGEIKGKTYAFIGLERVGGIMIYDISNPTAPKFAGYFNNRNFQGDAEAGTAGDLGPEGLDFIPANKSPNGKPLLAVGNEVSGTTTIFQIDFLN